MHRKGGKNRKRDATGKRIQREGDVEVRHENWRRDRGATDTILSKLNRDRLKTRTGTFDCERRQKRNGVTLIAHPCSGGINARMRKSVAQRCLVQKWLGIADTAEIRSVLISEVTVQRQNRELILRTVNYAVRLHAATPRPASLHPACTERKLHHCRRLRRYLNTLNKRKIPIPNDSALHYILAPSPRSLSRPPGVYYLFYIKFSLINCSDKLGRKRRSRALVIPLPPVIS